MRCNSCRDSCPAYERSGMEFDSPRGRVELIFEVLNNRIKSNEIAKIFDYCSKCKKCVHCPSDLDLLELFKQFEAVE